jgi:hypothetical protein
MNHALASTDARTVANGNASRADGSAIDATSDRLSHLFRVSLRSGRIHPLYLPVLKYRLLAKAGE